MFEDILLIAELNRSLEEIKGRLTAAAWRAFVAICRRQFLAARRNFEARVVQEAVDASIRALLQTRADSIARQILRDAAASARLIEDQNQRVVVHVLRHDSSGDERVLVPLDRQQPVGEELVIGVMDLLLDALDVSLPASALPERGAPTQRDEGGEPDAAHRLSPAPEESVPPEEPDSVDRQHINVWVHERVDSPQEPLLVGETYTLCFNVGAMLAGGLVFVRDRSIFLADIPATGLETTWIVSSQTVQFLPHPGDDTVHIDAANSPGGSHLWLAHFPLQIPRRGETPVRRIRVVPLTAEAPTISIDVLTAPRVDDGPAVAPEIYRQLAVELRVHSPVDSAEQPQNPGVKSAHTRSHWPAAHLALRPQHEWQTPPETLTVTLTPPLVVMNGTSGGRVVADAEMWNPALPVIEPALERAREALDGLRKRFQNELNDLDVDADAFMARLQAYQPHDDWSLTAREPGEPAMKRLHALLSSEEMRRLAAEGHTLYRELFPNGSKLHRYIDDLRSGARLGILWMKGISPIWIAHIPWSLIYTAFPPGPDETVDPAAFLGMRLRLAYQSHSVPGRSKSLGSRDSAKLACMLYWGEGDDTGAEAALHRSALATAVGGYFVPQAQSNRKGELLDYLKLPTPPPVAMLYFYCQCSAVKGRAPVLRFGINPAKENLVEDAEFPRQPLDDQPLIFVNACDSAGAHAYTANMLEQVFANRNCRAFIGTECKVPIRLASRFALAFLHFLYAPDGQGSPTSAGEAFVQARRFLWDEYRNLGGLFYCYVNQYELFLASDLQVAGLGAAHS